VNLVLLANFGKFIERFECVSQLTFQLILKWKSVKRCKCFKCYHETCLEHQINLTIFG